MTVKTTSGETFRGKDVLVTASIGVLQSDVLGFEPELPKWKVEAINDLTMTSFVKVFVLWETRWWDNLEDGEKRHFYTFLCDEGIHKGEWRAYLEVLPLGKEPCDDDSRSRMLLFAACGEEGIRVQNLSDAEVLEEIHNKLQRAYTNMDVPRPIDVYVPRWDLNPLFKGAFSFETVNKYESQSCLRSPVKRENHGTIWFAGEAMHDLYGGYLQAAYLSGQEQATEIINERL